MTEVMEVGEWETGERGWGREVGAEGEDQGMGRGGEREENYRKSNGPEKEKKSLRPSPLRALSASTQGHSRPSAPIHTREPLQLAWFLF